MAKWVDPARLNLQVVPYNNISNATNKKNTSCSLDMDREQIEEGTEYFTLPHEEIMNDEPAPRNTALYPR